MVPRSLNISRYVKNSSSLWVKIEKEIREEMNKAHNKTAPEFAVKNKGLYLIRAWNENDS